VGGEVGVAAEEWAALAEALAEAPAVAPGVRLVGEVDLVAVGQGGSVVVVAASVVASVLVVEPADGPAIALR